MSSVSVQPEQATQPFWTSVPYPRNTAQSKKVATMQGGSNKPSNEDNIKNKEKDRCFNIRLKYCSYSKCIVGKEV